MKKKPTHGGRRKGAGRPKTKEDTIVMRVPKSLVPRVKEMISKHIISEAYKYPDKRLADYKKLTTGKK